MHCFHSFRSFISLAVLSLFIFSCASTPTGRKQLRLIGSEQMDRLGKEAFEQTKKNLKEMKDPVLEKYVGCIAKRILEKGAKLQNSDSWEIKIFNEKSPNAFALPGGYIGIHRGLLDIADETSELATVIGHEVAHVVAQHGNERMSQSFVTQGGLAIADVLVNEESEEGRFTMAALGVGAQLGILLPYSRKQEKEADDLGFRYMVDAGYDPLAGASLWLAMSKTSKGGPPEFLSTHPHPKSRIENLANRAAKVLEKNPKASKGPFPCEDLIN
jgi:predicted Zn-dependent protease